MEDIGNGILGIKAAFEWGISDVVWQIEQDSVRLKDILKTLYRSFDKRTIELRLETSEEYGKGLINQALANYLTLSRVNEYDFSVHMSIGIIYLFHEANKEKALDSFDKAIIYAEKQSAAYYKNYALLYKALVKRDYGLIEEAEELTSRAVNTKPNLVEAIYQNAQYNALLNKQDKAIQLLKKVIDSDIVYCLKINNEPDFDGMRPQINKLFEEVRDERNKRVKHRQAILEEKVSSLDSTISHIIGAGYSIPKECNTKSLKEKNIEIVIIIANNSIFDARVAVLVFSQWNKRLQHNGAKLKDKCEEIRRDLENEIYKINNDLSKVKKKGNFLYFFIYLFAGQIVTIPIGLSMESLSGVYIAEVALLALCMYGNIILPRSKWEKVQNFLQEKKDKLDQITERIDSIGV